MFIFNLFSALTDCSVHMTRQVRCAVPHSAYNKLCAWRHNMPPPPCNLTISSHLFARWHLFRHVGYLRHQQQVDLRAFDLESGVRFTCDVGYICANFSLPRPLCSRVRPDVRDRQTDIRQTKASLNALYGEGIIITVNSVEKSHCC